MTRGLGYAAAAYALWGVFPVYFKALAGVPALEILAHRMAWSLLVCALALAGLRRYLWIAAACSQPRVLATFLLSAACVSINWGIYIWAVNAGHVVDASLGYFINPLVNVAFGALLLRERLRRMQWFAVALAALGVVWLTWDAGRLPWIGLVLALSFGVYGLLRKTASLGAIEGLALETALLFPLAMGYLVWLTATGSNTFLAATAPTQMLLVAAGPITAIPLLLFAAGARRISLTQLGLLQYIAPTLQFALGVWLYDEPFSTGKAAGFALIWTALAVFSAEAIWQMHGRARSDAPR